MTAQQQYSLIKKLYTSVSREVLLDVPALQRIGISNQRAASYAKSGWLVRVAHGLYTFPQTEPSLGAAVAHVSGQIPGLHLGGRSAIGDNSCDDHEPLVLWGDVRAVLPRWFAERYPVRYVHARLFDAGASTSILKATLEIDRRYPGFVRSTRERALLEMLYEVGCSHTLRMAQHVFYEVGAVCPQATGELLQRCTSVKAVRLYLRLARQAQLFNVDELLERCCIRASSGRRWVSRLKDGTTLCLGPYG